MPLQRKCHWAPQYSSAKTCKDVQLDGTCLCDDSYTGAGCEYSHRVTCGIGGRAVVEPALVDAATLNATGGCFEQDTNYAGNDIGSGINARAASPEECQRLCQLHGDECTVFTWASEGCYFKTSAEGRRSEAGDVRARQHARRA